LADFGLNVGGEITDKFSSIISITGGTGRYENASGFVFAFGGLTYVSGTLCR